MFYCICVSTLEVGFLGGFLFQTLLFWDAFGRRIQLRYRPQHRFFKLLLAEQDSVQDCRAGHHGYGLLDMHSGKTGLAGLADAQLVLCYTVEPQSSNCRVG
jgi:hypothetical protein